MEYVINLLLIALLVFSLVKVQQYCRNPEVRKRSSKARLLFLNIASYGMFFIFALLIIVGIIQQFSS
jgi:hypothetical protein